jgi:EAL domain-containing protein (putative c-di-GMP-specific phosphodiesterase class I)
MRRCSWASTSSSRQLFRPELVKEVRLNLGRAVIPKGSLRLEVTESLVMENPEKATAVLRELAEAGVGLALDDFGTGYSSLSYLNQFTFDTIKIDRSFLQASEENGTGSVILRSIIALAHELGKNVVVEGVEREEDVGLLRHDRLRLRARLILRRAHERARGAAAFEGRAPHRAAHEAAQPLAQA